jgi:putative ABC transport system permease protein
MINTMSVIFEQLLLHVPLILGAYISFSLLDVPDLSIESAYVMGACVGAQVLKATPYFISVSNSSLDLGFTFCVGLIASLVAGAVVGSVSSIFTQKGGFSHLLSSIVTNGLFHGINQYLFPSYLSLAGLVSSGSEYGMLVGIAAILVSLVYLLFKTQLGYAYAVYGTNHQFFAHYGISTHYVFTSGIMLANALAGLSGYLVGQASMCVELNMGAGKALFCITVLILGSCVRSKRTGASVLVPLRGVAIYFTLQQVLLKLGFNLKYFTAVQAIIVACIFLCVLRDKQKKSSVGM